MEKQENLGGIPLEPCAPFRLSSEERRRLEDLWDYNHSGGDPNYIFTDNLHANHGGTMGIQI